MENSSLFCRHSKFSILLLHSDLGMEVLLLKRYLFHNLLFRKRSIYGRYHPFILHIIKPMDDRNDFSLKFIHRFIDTYNIRILLFPIGCHYTGDIAIVDRIENITMLWVVGSHWSVYNDFAHAPNHHGILFPFSVAI